MEAGDAQALKERTGAIHRLDATSARGLVATFSRPAFADEGGIAFDRDDPVAGPTFGCMTLEPPAGHDGPAAVVGHYKAHLYLHGGELSLNRIVRLDAAATLGLAYHSHELYLDGVIDLSPFKFLDRLADLVPPLRKHRHRYHGLFAPNHPFRPAVTALAIGNLGQRADAATSLPLGAGRGEDAPKCPEPLPRHLENRMGQAHRADRGTLPAGVPGLRATSASSRSSSIQRRSGRSCSISVSRSTRRRSHRPGVHRPRRASSCRCMTTVTRSRRRLTTCR